LAQIDEFSPIVRGKSATADPFRRRQSHLKLQRREFAHSPSSSTIAFLKFDFEKNLSFFALLLCFSESLGYVFLFIFFWRLVTGN
jgi:hypothetical protein